MIFYEKAFNIGFSGNLALKAIALNNRNCAKWWLYFEEIDQELKSLESLQEKVDIHDEKLFFERAEHQKKFEALQAKAKDNYKEMVRDFKVSLQLLECKFLLRGFFKRIFHCDS